MSSYSQNCTAVHRETLLNIPYGKQTLPLSLRLQGELRWLLPGDAPTVDAGETLRKRIERSSLKEIVGGKGEVAIVVDDDTRPPYARNLLPPLLDFLRENGVKKAKIIVALGLHKPLNENGKRALFGNLPSWVEVRNHNPYHDLSPAGDIGGRTLYINRHFLSASLKVVIGDVELHQIFGYGGGAKSLVPGISDAETITRLHALLVHPMARPGILEGNPVQEFLKEVYSRVEVDFAVQAVLNRKGEALCVHPGALREAFLRGMEVVDGVYKVPVKEPFDVLIASAGGHPRDIDLYQTQKVINMARAGLKKGGRLILFSQCRNGIGPEGFVRWLDKGLNKAAVKTIAEERFEMGLHKLYLLAEGTQDMEIYLYSSIQPELVRRAFLTPLKVPEEVGDLIQGRKACLAVRQVGFVPFGAITLLLSPILVGEKLPE